MTLIASTSNYGYPILIGDMIASSDQVTEELVIPVFSKGVNQYLPSNNRYRPSEFFQKIYIISDVIAAGFAGSAYEIKLVLDDLMNHFKYKESTLLEIENFISNIDTDVFSMSSAFFIFMDKEGKKMHNLFINKDKFRVFNNEEF